MNHLLLKSFNQTLLRVGGKILIIIIAAGAYFGLKAIENSKNGFDREKAAPFAVTETAESNDDKGLVRIKLNDLQKMPSEIQEHVKKTLDFPFRNEDEFIARLNDSILEDKERESKSKQEELNTYAKAYITSSANFYGDISGPVNSLEIRGVDTEALQKKTDAALKGERISDEQLNLPNDKEKGLRAAQLNKLNASINELVPKVEAYNRAKAKIDKELQDLDDKTLSLMRSAYNSRPIIGKAVATAREKTFSRDPFSNVVLNERSGNYAIYQVVWYLFMIGLVFGLLYLIYALLKPLTPFAGGTDLLKDQTSSFFKPGQKITPELAKAAAVTVAALGIGTAVAVAGSTGGNRISRISNSDNGDVDIQDSSKRTRPPIQDIGGIERGPATGAYQPTVQVTTPIVYPSPMTVQSYYPSSDGPMIASLMSKIESLNRDKIGQRELTQQLTPINQGLASLPGFQTDMQNFKRDMETKQLPGLSGRIAPLENEFTLPTGRVKTLEGLAQTLQTDFKTRMDSVAATVEGMRNDSLDSLQRPTQQNLFGRVGRLVGKSHYMVSDQSFRALTNLMAKNPNDTLAEAKLKTDILAALESLKGNPPRNEGDFMADLGGRCPECLFNRWRTIILKYTRVSY
ncbi:MAG TPA: hypothetical protein VGC66_23445 [Pyrinomonadaceae bacterium]|jgi:hypothetical protein